jgi:predicted nucleic acid-binding protein
MEGVVIDTNVFVAAGFNAKSASARILAAIRERRFQLVWNEPTRRETEFVLRRIPPLRWDKFADLFRPEGEFTRRVARKQACRWLRSPRRRAMRHGQAEALSGASVSLNS